MLGKRGLDYRVRPDHFNKRVAVIISANIDEIGIRIGCRAVDAESGLRCQRELLARVVEQHRVEGSDALNPRLDDCVYVLRGEFVDLFAIGQL